MPTTKSLESLLNEARRLGHGRPVHLIVADALRRRIRLGGFAPGEKLPTERELSQSLGVGRVTVRQAMHVLADEQLIVSRRGRTGGNFVAERRAPTASQLARARKEFETTLRTTLEFRLAVEPLGAQLAAERATRSERDRLLKLANRASPTIEAFHSLDTRFHALIAQASDNHLIVAAVESSREEYFALGNALWINVDLRSGRPYDEADSELFRNDHLPVAEAVASGDPTTAAAAMRKHVRDGAQHFYVLLDQLASGRARPGTDDVRRSSDGRPAPPGAERPAGRGPRR